MMVYLAKRAWFRSKRQYRWITRFMRTLPDFLIIGAQKGGTDSLFRYLGCHPFVKPAPSKEVHFFDFNFEKGVNWYRSYFASIPYKHWVKRLRKQDLVTGEASPYYLFHPHAPRRAAAIVPHAKLIVLLRNPVDRAYSHYSHEVKYKFETLPFEECIRVEEERLRGETDRMLADEQYNSFGHRHFSYLSRGIYVDQLKAWTDFFDASQILVLISEEFFTNTPEIFNQVLDFLGLPRWQPAQFKRYNAGRYDKIDARVRNRLSDFFEPHNQRLYEYLGTDLGWNGQ